MSECLVTIIIPVYNTEKYLADCIDSVIGQTYKNIQIIIVDDGSTDKSAEICDRYEKEDRRITVVHTKNEGQASARNRALEMAEGQYIAFADSDDVLNRNYIEYMLKLANVYGADLVQCNHVKFWDTDNDKNHGNKKGDDINAYISEAEIFTNTEALEQFAYQRRFTPSPWGKLFAIELWKDKRFPTNMGYEDYAVMYTILGSAKKLVYSNASIYFYRIHDMSTQHAVFSEKKKDRIVIADKFYKYIEHEFNQITHAAKYRYCLAQFQYLMELPFDRQYKPDRKTAMHNIKRFRADVLKDKKASLHMKVMLLSSYLGSGVLMMLGRLFMKVTRR